MASTNYSQSIQNNSFYGQPTYMPLIGSQNGMQSAMSMSFPAQSSMLNYTPRSSVNWNSYSEVQLAQESFVDFGEQVFSNEDDDSSDESSLSVASKKITKASPQSAAKASKRSKRGRNPWTPKEDAKLMEMMKKYGQSWAMISSMMEGRTGKQVRDRYLNKLRPNIKLGDWSAQEDELVVTLIKEIGHRWSLIANHLPGRTEGQVKNRFYSHIKKRILPNGAYSHASASRSSSEGNSFAASPETEELRFDFGQDFDANMFNNACQPNFVQSKVAYVVEEEELSEESTTEGPASQKDSSSPLRNDLVDPTDVISYDAAESLFGTQMARADSTFYIPSAINDSHVDEMLNNVAEFFTGNAKTNSGDVDAFFAEEIKSEEKTSSAFQADDRLAQLNKRKAYLELALAKTLKEMKSF
jgi:hypothetical protein